MLQYAFTDQQTLILNYTVANWKINEINDSYHKNVGSKGLLGLHSVYAFDSSSWKLWSVLIAYLIDEECGTRVKICELAKHI